MSDRIVIIGSGNVASHLVRGFSHAGCEIVQVFSHSIDHARRLAEELGSAQAVANLSDLITDADFYLIAVTDAAVAKVAESMPPVSGLVAHTSGSVPLTALAPASSHTAVLYPLQTFTRDASVCLPEVPFFTEACDSETLATVDRYASLLSSRVYHADSARRQTLHIAGVLSCNFVNYLWDCTSQILAADGYDFSVVEPLIRATLDKAVALGPRASQTGPAMRCDVEVMRRHISLLDSDKADLYKTLTNSILKTHQLDCKL